VPELKIETLNRSAEARQVGIWWCLLFGTILVVSYGLSLLLPYVSEMSFRMDPAQTMREGFKLIAQRDFDSAEALMTAVLQQDPEKHQAYHGRAMIYREQGRLDEALSAVEAALQRRPEEPSYVRTKIGVLADLGRYDEAIQICGQMLERKVKLDVFQLEMGNLYYRQQKWDQALMPLKTALALNPDNTEAERLLAYTYMCTNQHAEAVVLWERLKTKDPGRAEYYYYLGLCLLDAGLDKQEALRNLKSSARLDSENFDDKVAFQIRHRGLDREP